MLVAPLLLPFLLFPFLLLLFLLLLVIVAVTCLPCGDGSSLHVKSRLLRRAHQSAAASPPVGGAISTGYH